MNPHTGIPSLLKQADAIGNLLQQAWHPSSRLEPAACAERQISLCKTTHHPQSDCGSPWYTALLWAICCFVPSLLYQNMETVDISIPANHDHTALPALIERIMSDAGLLADRLALRSYPGATHWHIRRPGAKGTLELTYWPHAGRLWFAVHANRRAEWIAPAIDELTARMMQVFR
jgi:hypothetical protein